MMRYKQKVNRKKFIKKDVPTSTNAHGVKMCGFPSPSEDVVVPPPIAKRKHFGIVSINVEKKKVHVQTSTLIMIDLVG